MTDNELLLSISNIMDKKIKPLELRFDGLEQRFDGLEQRFDGLEQRFDSLEQRFDGLEQRFNVLEQSVDGLSQRVDSLEKSVHIIQLDMENCVKPRLYTIESCYISTSRRFYEEAEHIEHLQEDMIIVKDILIEHGTQLQKIS